MSRDLLAADTRLDVPQWTHSCSRCEFLTGVLTRDPGDRAHPVVRLDVYLCRPVAKKVIENPRVVSRFGNDVTEQSSSRVAFPSDDPGILIGQAFSRIRQVWKNLDEEHKHKRANPAIDGL